METGSPGGSGDRSGEGDSPSKVQDAPPRSDKPSRATWNRTDGEAPGGRPRS